MCSLANARASFVKGAPTEVENEIPPWEVIVRRSLDVLNRASATGRSKPFRNLITDRDGTTNNYCDRYASSVQSAYNAAWLSHFARHCVDNAVFITAAPLGGRPSAEGLMELCVAPRGYFVYTGSKGREYYSDATQQLLEAEELPKEQRELVEELHRRILALCQQPGNTKFLGIGSGLQRKFGEVTMARNDPAGTVPEPESRRFMAAVRRVKEELDPDGTGLDLHDTGTDMEIFPRVMGGRPSFDKGDGVQRLDQKLGLHMVEGPNIVCGDTGSDLPMVLAALRLMCGDKMVERWQERLRQEETEQTGEQEEEPDDGEMDEAAKEEAERKAREEEEEEREARVSAGKLAVLFVASPESYSKSPKVADQVRKWCDLSGAHCALLPSPDVLVYTLAKFAEERSGSSVTTCHHGEPVGDPDLERDWTLTSLPHRDSVTSLPELPEPSGGSPSLIPSKAWAP
ncbi:tps-2 [Symbiodinium sp. CCMP2456]|nr:tps-2 [Symbiodinium sp. CCMP2456]